MAPIENRKRQQEAAAFFIFDVNYYRTIVAGTVTTLRPLTNLTMY